MEAGSPEGGDVERGPLGKADRAGQCMPDDCGGPVGYGSCWCDEMCHKYGDCCDNKADVCGAPTCEPQECGPKPLFLELCDDGSTAGAGDCVMTPDGCEWEIEECPEPKPGEGPCSASECGPSPLVLVTCDGEDIITHASDCERNEDGFCDWSGGSCPEECTPVECGPVQEIAKLCDDGSVVGMDVCTTQDDGACGWEFPPCPEPEPGVGPCAANECGPSPLVSITCDGEQIITHADSCERNGDGLCEWTLPECE